MKRGVKITSAVKMRVRTGRRYCIRCLRRSETRSLVKEHTITIPKAEKKKMIIT